MCPLSPNREAATVTNTFVAPNLDLALDVLRHLTRKITFGAKLASMYCRID